MTTTGSLAGTLGLIQPFRYRGYVYDFETGFYYLQSRYYDPTTGRFISADVLFSTGQGVLGHNCYVYCLDNPVNTIDSSGRDAIWIQEGGSAEGFGHSGLMVQDGNGNWYYFYWGPKEGESFSKDMTTDGVYCAAYVVKLDVTDEDLSTVQGVKNVLSKSDNSVNRERAKGRSGLITSTYYFKGDYTNTYDAVVAFSNLPPDNIQYNLIGNNCVEKNISAFIASDWRFSLIYNGHIDQYIIPNSVAARVAMLPSDKDKIPWLLLIENFLESWETSLY